MKIAVFVDEKGNTVSYSDKGLIELYALEDNHWRRTKKILLTLDEGTNIAEIRARIHAVKAEIEDSRVFIVETMKSLPIAIFDGYGITVWNHKGNPTLAFDFIKEQEANKAYHLKSCCDSPRCKSTCESSKGEVIASLSPVAIGKRGDGNYTIDLAKLLASDGSLNSKQILIPIFQNITFKKLEIICEHVPRWFEKELVPLKFEFQENKTQSGLHCVTVYPKE